MKVKIDEDLCTACGLCTDSVPEVFELGDEFATVIKPEVPPEHEDAVRDAAADCPVESIIMER